MEIRYMTLEEVEDVFWLEQQNFSHPWSQESIAKAAKQPENLYLVAVEGDKVLGYCGIWCSMDYADLCRIVVMPERRKQGIASALLDVGVKGCRERRMEKLLLEVRASNIAAIALYEKKKFQKIYTRRNYYSNPVEDACIMQLLL